MQIEPIKNNNNTITIVYSFNDIYSMYFSTALKSLIENSKKEMFYDIIVFSSDITEWNKRLLSDMLPQNFNIRFMDISKYLKEALNGINLKGFKYWSVEMYYRIAIPLIMRKYDKVLYLDSDTICKKDISELFNLNFENKKIIAIKDAFNLISNLDDCRETKEYILKSLKVDDVNHYFNSGVILFNIQKIDPNSYIDKLKKAFEIELTNCPDQDVLNYIFKNEIKYADLSWNMQYHIPILYNEQIEKFDKKSLDEYNKAFNNPAIIHYTSPQKPWNNPKTILAVDFWRYARKTDYYEQILHAMYENQIAQSRFAMNLYMKLQENKKVFLWGASIFLEYFFENYKMFSKNILGVIDINKNKHGKYIKKYEIFSPNILKTTQYDEIILTVVNAQDIRYEQVKKYLKDNKFENAKLIKL